MFRRSGSEESREGLFTSLKNLFLTTLEIGKTRLELLVTEVEEEKYRLIGLFSRVIGAAFLMALAILMVVFALAMAFWEQRVFVFSAFALAFACAALVLFLSVRRYLTQPSKLFRSSLVELEADMARLRTQREHEE